MCIRDRRYDNNQTNQTTARDLAIMTYNFIKKYPDILKYTSKPVVTVKKGTPYEETFETYNYSCLLYTSSFGKSDI